MDVPCPTVRCPAFGFSEESLASANAFSYVQPHRCRSLSICTLKRSKIHRAHSARSSAVLGPA